MIRGIIKPAITVMICSRAAELELYKNTFDLFIYLITYDLV